jgi:sulfite exporter TauE/SafE/copper chaperone CopZ
MSSHHSDTDMTATVRILGMSCGSCEIILERSLKKIKGVTSVNVDHRTGIAIITASAESCPDPTEIERVVAGAGYRVAGEGERTSSIQESVPNSWLDIGASLLIIFALWKLLAVFNLASIAPAANNALSFGGIFLIGLVAGTSSCLAVAGGLLLAVAAKYNESTVTQTRWQRFKPLLQFNIGRLLSYFLLGGVVGIIGQSLTLSARMTGILNIVIAFVMLWIALTILRIIPAGSCPIKPPKRLSHWIAGLSERRSPLMPFLLGALTFFLPCGFTQSLQLVALASGSFVTGALTMFIFALGTLPSLLGISALSSTTKGTFSRIFLHFSGTLVLVLALFNLQSSLAVEGFDVASIFSSSGASQGQISAPIVRNGVQDIAMRVTSGGYDPDVMTIKAGVPVRWTIDGTNAGGCTTGIMIPSLNIVRQLTSGPNLIEFTAPTPGRLAFSCTMGMVRGSFNVL